MIMMVIILGPNDGDCEKYRPMHFVRVPEGVESTTLVCVRVCVADCELEANNCAVWSFISRAFRGEAIRPRERSKVKVIV